MTGNGRADRNKDFEITTNEEEEKPEREKKEIEEEHPSEDIGIKQCAALGTTHSDTSGILEYSLDEDARLQVRAMSRQTQCTLKNRESLEADSSEPSAKKRSMATMHSRKLIFKVISNVKPRKFGENLLEKTEMRVNSRSRVVANTEYDAKTDVTKVSHAIVETEENSFSPSPFPHATLTSPRSQKREGGRICMMTWRSWMMFRSLRRERSRWNTSGRWESMRRFTTRDTTFSHQPRLERR